MKGGSHREQEPCVKCCLCFDSQTSVFGRCFFLKCVMMIQQAATFMDPVQQEIFVVLSACVSF